MQSDDRQETRSADHAAGKGAGISRGSVYYQPRPVSASDLTIMRRMDKLHLDFPFAGSRMLRDFLDCRRRQDRPPARRNADETHGDRGDLSQAEHEQAGAGAQDLSVSPAQDCRSTGRTRSGRWISPTSRWRAASSISPPWSTGSAAGFSAIGCRSPWKPTFCIEALEEALARHGRPEIFNTDQGRQFTSAEFTGVLLKAGIAISMDGKGSWRDNVFVERLWRSVKYEEVYLRAYDVSGRGSRVDRPLSRFYNSAKTTFEP